MHLSVAPIRACDRCWSPHHPMCPSCMESMKLKKARALDPEARWHPTRAADDVSEEALKRMSQDAFKGPCGRVPGYSRLSDLFGDIDAASWNDTHGNCARSTSGMAFRRIYSSANSKSNLMGGLRISPASGSDTKRRLAWIGKCVPPPLISTLIRLRSGRVGRSRQCGWWRLSLIPKQ